MTSDLVKRLRKTGMSYKETGSARALALRSLLLEAADALEAEQLQEIPDSEDDPLDVPEFLKNRERNDES